MNKLLSRKFYTFYRETRVRLQVKEAEQLFNWFDVYYNIVDAIHDCNRVSCYQSDYFKEIDDIRYLT